MRKPLLVVHGIANRDKVGFAAHVARLGQKLGNDYQLHPVFWGHLGPRSERLEDILPSHEPEATEGLWASLKRNLGGAAQHGVRGIMTEVVFPILGDIMVYQANRLAIQQEVRQVLAEIGADAGTQQQPICALGHSLGGVILFHLATGNDRPVWLDRFITLGSQPSFFHLYHPGSSVVPPYQGQPLTLPPTIARWLNIWDQQDWFAFAASKVFKLHDGQPVRETRIKSFDSFFDGLAKSHGAYWENEAALNAIRGFLT
jgi:hypothetical protein